MWIILQALCEIWLFIKPAALLELGVVHRNSAMRKKAKARSSSLARVVQDRGTCQCPDPTAIQKKSVRNHSYLPFFWTWGVGMRNNALLLKRGKTVKPRKPFEWCKELLHRKDRGQGTSMSKCHVNTKASMGILWFRWNLVQKGRRLQERARLKHVKEKKGLNFLGRHWLIIS